MGAHHWLSEAPAQDLVSDLELRIAIKNLADTAETLGHVQVGMLLSIACNTMDDVISEKAPDT